MRNMRRLICLLAVLVMCGAAAAHAEAALTWTEGQQTYPEGGEWTYRYTYRYPVLTDDTPAAASVNAWFDVAFREMDDLILPMFASEADMAGDGKSEISQQFAVTCNNDAFFSILLTQTQVLGEQTVVSLSGQVFAMSGEYLGDTLTLRGLLGVGESSTQIAEAIVADVYKRVQSWEGALDRWPDIDRFYEDFDPEIQFYADQDGNAVFFLQPGVLDTAPDALIFTYTAQEAEALLMPLGTP